MITFKPLKEMHFSRLLQWQTSPHVKTWWDQGITWTAELISKKYDTYTRGYKEQNGVKKTIHAYIICLDHQEIGYVQFYNAYDFLPEDTLSLKELFKSLAGLDIFIGEESFIGKGWGARIIKQFCKDHIDPRFEACFVDVENTNLRAIRACEKAGFVKVKKVSNNTITWMIRKK